MRTSTLRIPCLFMGALMLAAPLSAADVPVIGNGEEVDITKHTAKDRVTIFDFYSEYCPPCRRISPLLDKLNQTWDGVQVVKVDINRPDVKGIDWRSPVARQYKLQSIPHFKIYSKEGKLVAEGKKARIMVSSWLEEYVLSKDGSSE